MIVGLTIALFGIIYYIFLQGKLDNNYVMKFLYIILTASLIYAIYIPVKKFIKDEPVLKLSDTEIELSEKGKPVSLLWPQVTDWKVEKEDDGGTHYLIVHTAERKHKINISWLDKRPSEIEKLLQNFHKKS